MSLPAWTTDPHSLTLTEQQYDDLPDQVRKLIEVIDGHVIFCQSGTPEHSDVARRLANRLEAAKPAAPCARVSTDIDYTDTVDKLAEYAYEGIPVYLVVFLDGDFYVKMIQEYLAEEGSKRPVHHVGERGRWPVHHVGPEKGTMVRLG